MIGAREFTAFTAVGTAAAGVNLCVVAGTVPLGVSPLVANVVGFLVAFALSFIGHARWSFPATGRPVRARPATVRAPIGRGVRAERGVLRRRVDLDRARLPIGVVRGDCEPWPSEVAGEQTLGIRVSTVFDRVERSGPPEWSFGRPVTRPFDGSAGRPPRLRDRFPEANGLNSA